MKGKRAWAECPREDGAGAWHRDKEELEQEDEKSDDMTGAFHRKKDVIICRICGSRQKGGRGFSNCERCVKGKENFIGWLTERIMESCLPTSEKGQVVRADGCGPPEHFKEQRKEEASGWEMTLCKFLTKINHVNEVKSWEWWLRSCLKPGTKVLIYAAQERSLRTVITWNHECRLLRLCWYIR